MGIGAAGVRELDRGQVARGYDLEHPRLRERLDELAGHTAATIGAPVAAVTFLAQDVAVFAGHHGLGGWMARLGAVPAELAFCTDTVLTAAENVVADLAAHPRYGGNPLVTHYGLSCYAGIPVHDPHGLAIASACVIGTSPRRFTAAELGHLRATATRAGVLLEEYRAS
ncbi:hypothetical protein NUM3379_32890 [Kineococcus sp. NUM-3379]